MLIRADSWTKPAIITGSASETVSFTTTGSLLPNGGSPDRAQNVRQTLKAPDVFAVYAAMPRVPTAYAPLPTMKSRLPRSTVPVRAESANPASIPTIVQGA